MKKLLAGVLVMSCASNVVAQSDISYNYAQLNFVSESLDDFDCTQNGLAVSGNLIVTDDVFLTGGLTDVSGDACGSTTITAGAGFKADLLQDVSVFTSLSFASTQVDEGDGDTGLLFGVGGRAKVTSGLEARIQLFHSTAFDGTTTLGTGLNYWFSSRFSALGEFNVSSDSSSLSFGVRMDF